MTANTSPAICTHVQTLAGGPVGVGITAVPVITTQVTVLAVGQIGVGAGLPTVLLTSVATGLQGPPGPPGTGGGTATLPAGGAAGQVLAKETNADGDVAWVDPGSGPAGPQGPQGIQGPQGLKGDAGDTGPQGVQGATGPQGPQGIPGADGATGPQGLKGDTGDVGATGPQGPQGIQGIQGIQGPQGETGPAGTTTWDGITDKPATFTPSTHGHATSDVTGLDTALAGKESTITAGTTSQFWRGDKTWQDLFTQVRAATLTGLSTATSTVVAAADTVLVALGKLQAQITGHVASGGASHANVVAAGAAGFMTGADKTKLDGIATSANNYTHPTGDGNLHVPATSTTNNGKVLTAGATAGSIAWTTLDLTYLPDAAFKKSAVAATTAALTAIYANGTSGVGATLTNSGTLALFAPDGVSYLIVGSRVLVKNQSSSFQNGIYTVTALGSASVAWVLTRAADADTASELAGAVVNVDAGTVNGGRLFAGSFKLTDVVGTTAMTWDRVLDTAAIGVDVQAYDADLTTLAGLAKTDGNFIVGDGTNWVVESGATARTSLGLGAAATVNTGTSGAVIPLLSGGNTWSNNQSFSGTSSGAMVIIANAGTGDGLSIDDISISGVITNTRSATSWIGAMKAALIRSLTNVGTSAMTLASGRTASGYFGLTVSSDAAYINFITTADYDAGANSSTLCLKTDTAGNITSAGRLQATTDIRTSSRYLEAITVTPVNATALLTYTALRDGVITSTAATDITYTLPTGTLMESAFASLANGMGFEWSVTNIGSGSITTYIRLAGNTGHTIIGGTDVRAGASARFLTRKSNTNVFVTYRIAG